MAEDDDLTITESEERGAFEALRESLGTEIDGERTVQGELVRSLAALREEAWERGNTGWGDEHVRMARFVARTLSDPEVFDRDDFIALHEAVADVLDARLPDTRARGMFDPLTTRAMRWCAAHPEPIPLTDEHFPAAEGSQPSVRIPPVALERPVTRHLGFALLAVLVFFPLGLVAAVFALRGRKERLAGRFERARHLERWADGFAMAAMLFWLMWLAAAIALCALGSLS